MRKIALYAILLASAAIMAACSAKDVIASRVEYFVRSTYNDVDKIIMVKIDTVTVGDNLDYRIEQGRQRLEFAEKMLEMEERNAAERARYGGTPNASRLDDAKSDVWREKGRVAALDSLRNALAPDILNEAAAFFCCVAYNNPTNLVWVQVDPSGNLLAIDKDRMKMLINPGKDAPGYFEINDRFRKL